jgi:transposase
MTIKIMNKEKPEEAFPKEWKKDTEFLKSLKRLQNADPSTFDDVIDFVKNEKITYQQDWKNYDKSKTNEANLFHNLLRELLTIYPVEKKQNTRGRPCICTRDKIFAMCIKVFYKSDLRKTVSILKELHRLQYITEVPSYKSIDNFFNDESLDKVFDDLIFATALPLSQYEHTGGIDATGFSVSRFDRWVEHKWGKAKNKSMRVWRKAHVMSGCSSNTVISVKVTEKNVADCRMFEEVVANKTKFFEMEDFVADKAYSSKKIFEFLKEINLDPIIPYKKNITGRAKGSYLWAQMFRYFKEHPLEFSKRYNVRSNLETTFHMVKKRFGDNVQTKTLIANNAEIKIKFLCHNICVLIQELFETGLELDLQSCVKKVKVV